MKINRDFFLTIMYVYSAKLSHSMISYNFRLLHLQSEIRSKLYENCPVSVFFFKISIRNEQRFLNESNPIWNWLVYKFTLYCNTFWIKLMTFPIGISIERHLYWNISVYVCALWNVLLTRRRRFIIQFCSQLNFLFGFLFGNRKILLLWNAHSFFDNCIQFLLLFLLLLLLMLQKYT